MKSPQQYTSAEIKLIDRALKKNWKRKKLIALIIILILSAITIATIVVSIVQKNFDLKNMNQYWVIFLVISAWGSIYENCNFFELIKKLAISNADNDPNKP